MEPFFAVCAPGLEPYVALELHHLGLDYDSGASGPIPGGRGEEETGGVAFGGGIEGLYQANLWLRTASRILVRLGGFRATAFSELRKKAGRLAWERYIRDRQPVALRVTCKKSRLYHSDAVAERIAGAIGDRLGQSPDISKFDEKTEGDPPQLIIVRFFNDECTISIDSSGALLHRRGYRQATTRAPLRETLAAGLLFASEWDPGSALLDPFCGSGTIPIEAAILAKGWAPGQQRRFAFMEWPGYQETLWNSCLEASKPAPDRPLPPIMASDRDAGAIKMAQANAERADVLDSIQFSCRAVSSIEPQGKGWVVTNPPYGMRVSADKDLRNLYAQFGKVVRSRLPGWRVAILCSELQLLKQTGLQLDTSFSFINGGIPVRLGRGQAPDHDLVSARLIE
jgi:putative N6-adenine-specific DNA methylase